MNSEFSFKAEEPSLSYYLPIAGGRIIGFIPFPRVLVLCEMQSVSPRIWTGVAESISYDDNHYTTGTSNKYFMTNTLYVDTALYLRLSLFPNGPVDWSSIPGRVIPNLLKMVLDTSLFNSQKYKVRIKSKVDQSRERISAPLHLCVTTFKKGSLRVVFDYGQTTTFCL